MANYSVRLVDHTANTTDHLKQLIKKHLQEFFNQVFDGQSDTATVDWGTATESDRLVLHFVEDVDHSYISEKLPGKAHRPDGGGFTRPQGGVTGSEFYKFPVIGGEQSQLTATGYAKMAFHEGMHNKTGMSNQDLHGSKGGGGLASSPPQLPLTDTNKTLMQGAMANTNRQLL